MHKNEITCLYFSELRSEIETPLQPCCWVWEALYTQSPASLSGPEKANFQLLLKAMAEEDVKFNSS